MRKILILLILILCCILVSLKLDDNSVEIDAISGLGYDGHNKLIEEFFNNKN